ncbi:hypothetical protein B0H14DRAFT_2595687 [Mycena olivaceomarginata]|nr:hypothetical protein B0H14DRAFT_2595687 [Mycena olivaceomarginata]
MDELCECTEPSQCQCSNSQWDPRNYPLYPSLLPTSQFPPSTQLSGQSHLAYGGSPSGFVPQYYHFVTHPLSGTSSPVSSGHSTPSARAFSGRNSAPCPLTDTTNSATQPAPRTGDKRKRAQATSGNAVARPPKRVAGRDSTTSNPPVSVSAARSCGVGPSTPFTTPRSTLPREAQSPHTPVPPSITTVPPPISSASTERPDTQFTSKKAVRQRQQGFGCIFFCKGPHLRCSPGYHPPGEFGGR